MTPTTSAMIAGSAVLTATTLGSRHGPQRPGTAMWYSWLRKPGFTPAGPTIGAAWSVLDLLLAATGYRLLRAAPTAPRNVALGTWSITLLLLAEYPRLFFGKKRLAASTAAAGLMLAAAGGTAAAARKVDAPAAAMTIPLLLWLSFATVLSEELWRRNPRLSRD